MVGQLSSIFGNTEFNTLRMSWTMEDINRSNPQNSTTARSRWELPATQSYQNFIDVQNPAGERRINHAWHLENTFSWFVPGKKGDHDIKVGAQFQAINHRFDDQTNMNGTFTFRSDAAFNANDPRPSPNGCRFACRRPTTASCSRRRSSASCRTSGASEPRLTLSLGVRYDVEIIPIRAPVVAPLMR